MTPKKFGNAVLRWFDQHGRHDLPWQKNSTAYRVWISEIMLQQTQVNTVIPYYHAFMRSFPSLRQLAMADIDKVMAHWSGLGYYSRARNLHHTAQIIRQEFRGRFPRDIDTLVTLPGIGRSTAGAIMSLGMGLAAPILDGNVKRVLARYHAVSGWPGKSVVLQQLWQLSINSTPQQRTGDYNQAMMDLGATVCTRSQPACLCCPLRASCKAYSTQEINRFPGRKPKAKHRRKESTYLLIMQDSEQRVLLERRPNHGIWGGLWCFPECITLAEIAAYCERKYQCHCLAQSPHPSFIHQFSHYDLNITPVSVAIQSISDARMDSPPRIWYKQGQDLPGGIAAPTARLLTQLA